MQARYIIIVVIGGCDGVPTNAGTLCANVMPAGLKH